MDKQDRGPGRLTLLTVPRRGVLPGVALAWALVAVAPASADPLRPAVRPAWSMDGLRAATELRAQHPELDDRFFAVHWRALERPGLLGYRLTTSLDEGGRMRTSELVLPARSGEAGGRDAYSYRVSLPLRQHRDGKLYVRLEAIDAAGTSQALARVEANAHSLGFNSISARGWQDGTADASSPVPLPRTAPQPLAPPSRGIPAERRSLSVRPASLEPAEQQRVLPGEPRGPPALAV